MNFKNKDGCILADDMGLGKTVQIGTYLSSLIFEGLIRRAIVVVPATLIEYWTSEIRKWLPAGKNLQVLKIYGQLNSREDMVK